MSYHGDIRLGDTLDIKFTTRQTTGVPFTLAGSPVISAYVGNSTTEITAGITLTADFDSRTGLNNVRVVATSGNGFATASDVELVITTGTVNGVSVVGEVIGSFSIEHRSGIRQDTTLAESYAANGAAPTLEQALLMIQAMLTEASVTATTLTAKKLDHSTTAATFTLNDASSPTSITRAS